MCLIVLGGWGWGEDRLGLWWAMGQAIRVERGILRHGKDWRKVYSRLLTSGGFGACLPEKQESQLLTGNIISNQQLV